MLCEFTIKFNCSWQLNQRNIVLQSVHAPAFVNNEICADNSDLSIFYFIHAVGTKDHFNALESVNSFLQ